MLVCNFLVVKIIKMMMVLLFKDSIVIRIVKIVLKIVKELMILFVDMKLFFLVELIDKF